MLTIRNPRFAVEALLLLATEKGRRCCTAEELARLVGRSTSYVEHLMSDLRKAGLVRSKRGPGGGYRLAKEIARITVAEVFRVLDTAPVTEPPNPRAGSRGEADLMWRMLQGRILTFLDGVTLADIARAAKDAAPPSPGARRLQTHLRGGDPALTKTEPRGPSTHTKGGLNP